jgi:membrane-bound metal-dependent hydrolase YbcI (DUF457 family)
MSWAAHELESYFIQKHVKVRVSYLAILLGCLLPDLFTKLPVYGFSFGILHIKPEHNPWKYHRGWPGVGFTHSLMFGIVFAIVVLAIGRSRAWFLGIIIGSAAHVLTDMFDSVGTMLLFPFTTQHYTIGMWAYASQQGRYGDAAAYYSSLGGVWDFLWLCLAITGRKVFTAEFFFTRVEPNDGAWSWIRRTFAVRDTAILALYRAYFVYGAARIFAWFIWARLTQHVPLDWTWGGPFWVMKATTHYGTFEGIVARTLLGLVGLALTCRILWLVLVRRLWQRGKDPDPPRRIAPIPQEGRADLAIYVFTWLSLIALGAWLTTPILNWIVGPAYVVTVVSLVTPRVRRFQYRRSLSSQSRAHAHPRPSRDVPARSGIS